MRWSAVTFTTLLFIACAGEIPVQVAPNVDPSTCCPVEESPSEVTPVVVIDDSISMRGYLEANRTVYQNIVVNAVTDLTSSPARTTVRRLSRPDVPLTRAAEQLSDRTFYNKSISPLTKLFERIHDSTDQSLWVIITDLRQAPMDVTLLQEALHSALERYAYVKLIGFDLYHSSTGSARMRPIYVLVLAKSRNDMRWLDDYTNNESRSFWGRSIDDVKTDRPFGPYVLRSRPAVTFADAAEDFDSESRGHWNRFADPKKTPCPAGQIVVCSTLSLLTSGRPVPIGFHVNAITTFDLKDPLRIQALVYPEDESCGRDSISPKVQPLPGRTRIETAKFEFSGNTGALSLRAEYNLPLPKDLTAASYRVEYMLGRGNAIMPKWITDWTTSDPNDPTKTLNLGPIAETIVRHVTERDVFLIHHVFVRKVP